MGKLSTIAVFRDDLPVIDGWCEKMGMTRFELVHEWIRRVKLRKQADFYSRLPMPSNFCKPLINIKIDKKYIK
jgi:hypothetical protein